VIDHLIGGSQERE